MINFKICGNVGRWKFNNNKISNSISYKKLLLYTIESKPFCFHLTYSKYPKTYYEQQAYKFHLKLVRKTFEINQNTFGYVIF